ncbi:MAG: TetR/AcrR family transcriptional regulator [Solirubrobacteraceae bacterium]
MGSTDSTLEIEPAPSADQGAQPGPARERILAAAYELFSHRGIRAVGIDAILARSGVARQTLYRHFGSKQELVLAFLARREELWTKEWLQREVERRAAEPQERLLAIFEVFDGWFRSPGFEGCSFVNVMLESADPADPLHRAGASYLAGIRDVLQDLARQTGLADPERFARKWHILMKGSIVSAGEGDQDAARLAREMAAIVLAAEQRLDA